ncbi:winged helix-turn-helix transcriptional regulator [Frankia sp. AgB1.9]|uniref:MarR family winged helix-turn-helix transcriptional regulator n=1 Tax=unclassified Frankia TaxID=2632575 RepID=UPI0019328CBC|nr:MULTISPECIES: MarR family winged helix-turn-helix transcriptional regulator [unclassified Frankia]MBL7486598.1 winged helix-turn-helix transcriptional regulator [Frankia sp. AgW1.1]MBL7552755.1 winged helix-turn-helix transcriptional regulator [Frankia sp. AgB1.9]MBL7618300.1 winged helix-turn-helix transcriptional regulator [Frankia sp. AgB1.8]
MIARRSLRVRATRETTPCHLHLSRSATPKVKRQAEGLTPTQASVLGLVVARGSVGVAAIVAAEGINPTMLSRVLGKLVDMGLVVRGAAQGDLRAVTVAPTDRGCELQERLKKDRADSVARLVSQLTPQLVVQLEECLPALERLADASTGTASAAPRRIR